MFTLDKLKPLVKKRKRVGRGGSRGGTSGKGHKGQKARSGGGVDVGFEGGQMPLYRRLPKRGFTNARFKKIVCIVHLDSLNRLAQSYDEITTDILIKEGVIKPKKNKPFVVKVLGDGAVSKPITITADAFSATAREVIEKAGGKALPTKG